MANPHADPFAPDVIALDGRFGPLSGLVTRLSALPVDKLLIYLVDQVDARLLPELARQFSLSGLEGWSLARTDDERRALIRRSIALHRKKGTPWALREALKAAGLAGLDIDERLPVNRFDGTLAFGGAQTYSAYNWAQFRLTAVAGDDQPISAAQTALMVQVVNEWKPMRSHLVDVQHRVQSQDRVTASEALRKSGALSSQDQHLWGHHFYDGSLAFDQGQLHRFDGALRYNGAAALNGFSATPSGARFEGERETSAMAAQIVLSDRQIRVPAFDAQIDYSGHTDFGERAPVATDPPMPVQLRRHRRYDGRMAFSLHRFDGAARYAGHFTHFGNSAYSGDEISTLEIR